MKRFYTFLLSGLIFCQLQGQIHWPHNTPFPICTTMPANCTKVALGGNWNNAASWSPSGVPTADQVVCIPSGVTINVIGTVNAPKLQIFVCGTLDFDHNPPGKLQLAAFSFIQVRTGGLINARNGDAELISIGGNEVWRHKNDDIQGPWILSWPYIGAGVLNVDFEYLRVKQDHPYQVTVEWATSFESNAVSFAVERSKDQHNWSTIGTVAAHGNSTQKQTYHFTDGDPVAGQSFYRVREINHRGPGVYSQIISHITQVSKKINLFPNPVSTTARVFLKEGFKNGQVIQLINSTGSILKNIYPVTGNSFQLDMSGYLSGLYRLQLVENGKVTESVLFVKQ